MLGNVPTIMTAAACDANRIREPSASKTMLAFPIRRSLTAAFLLARTKVVRAGSTAVKRIMFTPARRDTSKVACNCDSGQNGNE